MTSVQDILLESNEGFMFADASGVEKNPYLELFSSETTFGSASTGGTSSITFNGDAELEAGSRYQQSVHIDAAGNITLGDTTVGVVQDWGSFSSRASLQAYIDTLNAEKTALENAPTDSGTNEGTFNDGGQDSGGDDSGSGSTDGSVTSGSLNAAARIDEIAAEIASGIP